eukprot:1142665-Pelagomonas_calceolata.AAC.5
MPQKTNRKQTGEKDRNTLRLPSMMCMRWSKSTRAQVSTAQSNKFDCDEAGSEYTGSCCLTNGGRGQGLHAFSPQQFLRSVRLTGELADIVVMEGRGFGFVTYADPKNAATFLETKDHTIGECLQLYTVYTGGCG